MRFGKKFIHRAPPVLLAALAAALCLLCRYAGAEQVSPSPEPASTVLSLKDSDIQADTLPTTLFLNSHEIESMTEGRIVRYRFTPPSSDTYTFRSFPIADETVPAATARLIRLSDGEVVAEESRQDLFSLTCPLEAEENYELEITAHSAGALATEVMLNARGRSFDNPISLPSESIRYAKTIVRARDVHWFSFVAPVSGWYSIRTEKTGDTILDTIGLLTDSSGRVLASNDDILFPGDANFMIQYELTAGETYFVRISAFSNLTGAYRLVLTVPEENQPLPESVLISPRGITLDVDQKFTLSADVFPENTLSELVFSSSDSQIASVEPDGTVRAVSAGEATIWAISYGGVKDGCTVTVNPVPLEDMSFEEDSISIYTNEQASLSPLFEPSNASDQSVRYESSDQSVVTVSEYGVLTGISEGRAVVTAVASDGGYTASVEVQVGGIRPVYRALVLGEINYTDGSRLGGENTVRGVYDMLVNQSIDGAAYQTRLQLDSTREEIAEGIRLAFSEAKETDLSLFYINCHGSYEDGSAYIRLHDETRITVDQLESMIQDVPGKIVLILDFCQSGAFIGAGEDAEQLAGCTDQTLSGRQALTSGKYIVITSASSSEDSYRRSFTSGTSESSTAAIMGRSLCEGAGWDIIYDRSVSLKADADKDGLVTVQEIFEYTKERVAHYLEGTDVTQTVYFYAEDDQTVLFGKE